MNRCAIAGTRCPREATITVHIEHVGERAMCEEHADLIAHSGMLVRVIEPLPRRLARIVASTLKPGGRAFG